MAQACLDPRDDVIAYPLGLGQRQAAAWQCRAGERPARGRRDVLGAGHTVLTQHAFDRVPILRADLAQDDILARHQDRIASEPLDDFVQGGANARLRAVDDPSARHRNAEIQPSVALLMPAEMIGNREGRHFARRFERFAEIFLEALARPVFAVLGDHVFETGMTAVAAIAMIAMQPHHRSGRFEEILRLDEGHRGREPRVGLRIVVGLPWPPPSRKL